MASHTLERAYDFLSALSRFNLSQLPGRILFRSLTEQGVSRIMNITNHIKTIRKRSNRLVRFDSQTEFCHLLNIDIPQLPEPFLVIAPDCSIIAIVVVEISDLDTAILILYEISLCHREHLMLDRRIKEISESLR